MIYKDISFIEKVLSEQEHLKSKCEHKLDSLQVYKRAIFECPVCKRTSVLFGIFPGRKKALFGKGNASGCFRNSRIQII